MPSNLPPYQFKHTPESAAALLIAAIQTNEYKKTTGCLVSIDGKACPIGWCIQGVMCDVFNKHEPAYAQPMKPAYYGGASVGMFFSSTTNMPQIVQAWYGLNETGAGLIITLNDNTSANLLEIAQLLYPIRVFYGGGAK